MLCIKSPDCTPPLKSQAMRLLRVTLCCIVHPRDFCRNYLGWEQHRCAGWAGTTARVGPM